MSPEIPNASNKQLGVALKVGMIITHQKTKLLDDFNGGTTVVILDAVGQNCETHDKSRDITDAFS